MLRLLAAVLLAANVAFFAWTQGWLSPWAMPPMSSEREPERIATQVRPETVTLLSPEAAAAARQAASAAEAPASAASVPAQTPASARR